MKRAILFTLLCSAWFGSNGQGTSYFNTSACDVNVTFIAIDVVTCNIVATSVINPYLNPAGNMPPGWIIPPVVWVPAPPSGTFAFAAEVTYSHCPGSTPYIVGPAMCGYVPHVVMPMSPCGCGPVTLDFPSIICPAPIPSPAPNVPPLAVY